MIGSLATTAAGVIGGGIGSWLSGNAESRRKAQLSKLANVAREGIDYGGTTTEALGNIEGALPKATAIGQAYNDYYANEYQRLMEQAYPGYSTQRGQYSDITGSLLRGEIPSDVASNVYRSAAGKSLFGGYGGASGLQRNMTARDLGKTSLGMMQTGAGMLAQAPSIFGAPKVYDVSSLTGLTPTQQTAYYQRNLENYLAYKAQAIGAKGASDVWGNYFSSLGGMATGAGMSSLLGGMGGGSAATPSAQQSNWITSYTPSNTYQPYQFAPGTSASYIQAAYGG